MQTSTSPSKVSYLIYSVFIKISLFCRFFFHISLLLYLFPSLSANICRNQKTEMRSSENNLFLSRRRHISAYNKINCMHNQKAIY